MTKIMPAYRCSVCTYQAESFTIFSPCCCQLLLQFQHQFLHHCPLQYYLQQCYQLPHQQQHQPNFQLLHGTMVPTPAPIATPAAAPVPVPIRAPTLVEDLLLLPPILKVVTFKRLLYYDIE